MIDGIVPDEMTESVKYDSSLDSYRSNAYDALAIYGFTIDGFEGGLISSNVIIQDGLRIVCKRILHHCYSLEAIDYMIKTSI